MYRCLSTCLSVCEPICLSACNIGYILSTTSIPQTTDYPEVRAAAASKKMSVDPPPKKSVPTASVKRTRLFADKKRFSVRDFTRQFSCR